jgi:hypothetical protein
MPFRATPTTLIATSKAKYHLIGYRRLPSTFTRFLILSLLETIESIELILHTYSQKVHVYSRNINDYQIQLA